MNVFISVYQRITTSFTPPTPLPVFFTSKTPILLILLCGIALPSFLHAQEWKLYTPANSPVTDITVIRDIAADPVTNDVWIAAGTFLYQRKKDGAWVTYETGATPGLANAGCVVARNGIVWVGPFYTPDARLSYFNGTAWQSVTVPNAVFNAVIDIEIAEGFVWIATDRGLFQYDGQTWKKLDHDGEITQPTAVSWDATAAKLWISVNCVLPGGNVFRYTPADGSWKEYETGEGRCGHAVQALPDGNAYYGSCNTSTILSVKNEIVSPVIKSACVPMDGAVLNPLAQGEVWFATDFNYGNRPNISWGLLRYDGNSIVASYNFQNSPMKGGGVEALAVQRVDDATAVVWMKTYKPGPDPMSNTEHFLETYTYTIITGVEDKNTATGIQIFPVPARDHFTVKIQEGAPQQMPLKLTLYSVLGEIIAEHELHDPRQEVVFNVSGLSCNMLLLRAGNSVFKVPRAEARGN